MVVNRFAMPVSDIEIQAKIVVILSLNRRNTRTNGLLTCLRIGDSKEIRKSTMLVREVIVLQVYRLYKLLRSNVGRRTKSDFSIVRL